MPAVTALALLIDAAFFLRFARRIIQLLRLGS